MKILFADSLDEDGIAHLTRLGHECVSEPSLDADSLPTAVGDADALVVRSTRVTAATIDAGRRLALIVRAGAGTDNIDQAAASAKGIYVCNVPGKNAIAVAELTMALILAIDRHVADGVADLRVGTWDKKRYTDADGLAGKTLALIGLGDIGLAVAERAKAFGMVVAAVRKDDRDLDVQARIRSIGIRLVEDVATLLSDADIVSLHVPKDDSTLKLVDDEFLARLRPGAVLINTSRGDVVDEAALLRAIDDKGIHAGLDVWADEPAAGRGTFSNELATHPNVVGSHHIGASTRQAQAAIARGAIEVIENFARGQIVNCVNLVEDPGDQDCLAIRHLDRVGVLAQVFAVLRSHGLNVQQVQNQVFTHGGAAVATIYVGGDLTDSVFSGLEAIEEVIAVSHLPGDPT